ncbi:kinase-like domain-containing protein [Gaertneriomyces semiglobifer]|nr:kinase-like domain-containing protein [Gaertneriomyces semiglobifer]
MSISWDDLHEFEDLAAGSFGVLQKADYLGTEVAVKEFLDLSGQPGFDLKKYIGREVEILQATRHPNVVQFMGCCLHDNKLYLVTEFVPGGNLKRWIKDSQKDFGWRLRVGFATDVSRALSYLHAHKIIHRDLKSENLLITENRRIKICDFGFSREVAVTPEERKRLSFCGTDAYMAPEIMLGMDFDERVDIFSFGVILCEIITRSIAEEEKFKRDVPFMNIAPDSICADLGCPPQLLEIAVACTDADPEKRPKLKDIMQKLRLLEAETIKANPEHLGVLRNSALSLIGHDTLQRSDSVASIISVEDESVHSSAGSRTLPAF